MKSVTSLDKRVAGTERKPTVVCSVPRPKVSEYHTMDKYNTASAIRGKIARFYLSVLANNNSKVHAYIKKETNKHTHTTQIQCVL